MKIIYALIDGKRVSQVLRERKCRECGNTFMPKRMASKYCSRKCSAKAENKKNAETYRARAAKWYEENKEQAAKRRKEYYWSNPEYFKAKTKEWIENNKEHSKAVREKRRDEVQHGSQRAKIIKESKGICSICKKDTTVGWRDSVVHHANFDKKDHSHQILVCRACHARLHLRKAKTGRKYFSSE